MRLILKQLCFTIFVFVSTPLHAESVLKIKTFGGMNNIDRRFDYVLGLLNLALEKTKKDEGPFEVTVLPGVYQEKRFKALLSKGVDVVIHPVARDIPAGIQAIKFPVRQGLLGERVLLIRKEDQKKFKKVKNLKDLLKFKMGFNSEWQDFAIYRDAGFVVVENSDYNTLFEMLAAKKFDFIPRAIGEIEDEIKMRKPFITNLAVEKTLLLYYPLDEYFYVRSSDSKLAERIERGIDRARTDGSYHQYFDNFYAEQLMKIRLSKRTIINLNNNFLPLDTPLKDSNLWKKPDVAK